MAMVIFFAGGSLDRADLNAEGSEETEETEEVFLNQILIYYYLYHIDFYD